MVYQALLIFGSISLFLYGMSTLSEGIQKAAGHRLQSILNFMTGSRFAAILTGFVTTLIVQSSSTTSVIVISFVNAALIQLPQALGVIMGANIGTTITGWLVATFGFSLSFSIISLPAIGVGFVLLVTKKFKRESIGEILIGLGILFIGLDFLKNSVPDISKYPEILQSLTKFSGNGVVSYLFFVLVGFLLTVLVQSSSATMAINLTMAYSGWYDFSTAAAIVIGANVGTTITAYIASFGTSIDARRASYGNIFFNIFGFIWISILFVPFLHLINIIVPGDVFGADAAHIIPFHLTTFHTLYNICNTILASFFVPQIIGVTKWIVKGGDKGEGAYQLRYIRATLQDSPELYLLTVKRELFKMADIIAQMFSRFWHVFSHPDIPITNEFEKQKEQEDLTDQMQEQLTTFLSKCSMDSMNRISAVNLHSMMRITNELESIGDSCFNLMFLSEKRHKGQVELDDTIVDTLYPYIDLVNQFLRFIRSHLNEHVTSESMAVAVSLENEINKMRNILQEGASDRLQAGHDVKAELLYIDIVRHVEQIGDHCLNISESLAKL